ncbi:MAG: hypothetical protein U1A27_09965 [Phycisphaerae bacterium]
MLVAVGLAAAAVSAQRPGRPRPAVAPPADEPAASEYATVAERITPQHINRVRFMELRAAREVDRGPDRIEADHVTVRIPQDVAESFLNSRVGATGFKGEAARRRFLTLPPPQKLAVIAYWVRDTEDEWNYADQIEVQKDPDVMVEFRRRVQPVIINNCATAACHGNADVTESRMRLYNDPRRSETNTYANFLTLREWSVGGMPLLNHDRPADSLLLSYMLKRDLTRHPHPQSRGFRAMLLHEGSTQQRAIETWIGSLRRLQPTRWYGFHLLPAFAATSAPGSEDDALPPPREAP